MASYSIDSNTFKNGRYVYTKKYVTPISSGSSSSSLGSSGGVISGSVIISGVTNLQNNLVFPDASVQTRAVTNEMFTTLENITNSTSRISMTNDITIVDGTFQSAGLNISGNINFPPQSIGQEVIDGLPDLYTDYDAYKISNNTNITDLQTSVSTVNTSITDINNSLLTHANDISSHSTSINALGTNIAILEDSNVIQQGQIDTNTSQINLLISEKQDVISNTNKISSFFISTGENETLDNKLTSIDNSILTKQNIINNTTNQLPISHVQNLTDELATLGSQISTLTGLQSGDFLTFQMIQDNFDTIDTAKQNTIDASNRLNANLIGDGSVTNTILGYLSNVDADIQTQINNLQIADNAIHSIGYDGLGNTTIADTTVLTTLKFSGDNSVQTTGFTSAKNTELSNATSNISTLQGQVTTAQSDILLKQDIIDVNNKLSSGNVDYTSSALRFVDINSNLQQQLTGFQNSINSLQSYDSTQSTFNTSIASDITDLQTGKQDAISISNKLSVANVDLGVSSLSFVDISSSLQGDLNSITNDIDAINTGLNNNIQAIANLVTADVLHQNAINANTADILLKQNIIDTNNLLTSSLVSTGVNETLNDKLTLIDNDIATKQDIINGLNKLPIANVNLSGSSLNYVDISSSLQTQLTNINDTISTLTTLQSGDLITFQNIQNNFDVIDTTKQNTIDASNRLNANLIGDGSVSNTVLGYLSNVDADIQTQINNLQIADNAIHSIGYDGLGNTTIADTTVLTTLKFSGDNSVQTTGFTSAKNTELSTATSNITSLQTLVTTAQSDISLKQDIIDVNNKLSSGNVDYTSSALRFVDINSSLQTQLSGFTNALTALQDEDTAQNTLNSQFTADINNLQTTKQNVIDASNKINSLYVSYNGINVKDELDALENYHSTNDTTLTNIQNDITSLETSKQDTISISNKLSVANVDLGVSSLSFVDISSSLQGDLNSITNDIDAINTGLNNNSQAISNLVTADVLHQNAINANTADILLKQDIIDTNNLLTSSLVETGINETLNDKLTLIDNSIATKQNIINGLNKLPVANVNLSGSSLNYVDISSSLQTQLTDINDTISTLTTLQSGDASSFTSINNSINTINTTLTGKQDALGSITNKFQYLANVSSDIQTQINNVSGGGGAPSIAYDAPTTTTTISDTTVLTTLKFSGDNSVQTTAFTSAKNTELSTATSNITSIQTSLSTAQSDILLKQNIIDVNNKLPIANVENLQTQLTGINNVLTALQDEDTSQLTLNNQFTTDITSLQTDKQNVINGLNKLSSSFVSYNATDVSTELGSINSALSGKAPLANPSFTGTVSGITKSMVGLGNVDDTSDLSKPISTLTQSALDLKAPLSNPSFTGTVSGITKSMIGLTNVDDTSDASKPISTATQTALNAKLNLSGGTMTGRIKSTGTSEVMSGVSTSGTFYYVSYDSRNVWYSTVNASQNFTFIINNLPPADTNVQHTACLLYKGDFICSLIDLRTANVGYTTITPTWVNGVAPTAGNNSTKLLTVTILYCFGSYQALCSLVQYY